MSFFYIFLSPQAGGALCPFVSAKERKPLSPTSALPSGRIP